jgi:hypothetical protein
MNVLIAFILLCSPVTVVAIGWGYMQIFHTFGMVPFLVACVSGFVTLLGFASLLDRQ